jgi:hypothetical protein
MTLEVQRELAGRAMGYLMAANVLDKQSGRSALVDIPKMHMIGVGLEMLLKDALMEAGKTVDEVTSCGDRLLAMWEADAARPFRDTCRESSEFHWEGARTYDFAYDLEADPWESFQDEVIVLDDLHSRKAHYPFAYVLSDAPAPWTPAFLLATLLPIANHRSWSFVEDKSA